MQASIQRRKVLVPQAVDQFDVARVIRKRNAGLALNKNEINITPDVIKNAVNEAYNRRDEFRTGTEKILESFKEARKNRTDIYKKVFA